MKDKSTTSRHNQLYTLQRIYLKKVSGVLSGGEILSPQTNLRRNNSDMLKSIMQKLLMSSKH